MKGLPGLHGRQVTLRPAELDDHDTLLAVLAHPGVRPRWGFTDPAGYLAEEIDSEEVAVFVIEAGGRAVGIIRFSEEADPDYRSAGIDVAHPDVHGRGFCTDAVRTLARYLIADRGYHRSGRRPRRRDSPLREGRVPARGGDAALRARSRRHLPRWVSHGPAGRRATPATPRALTPRR